MKKIYNYPQADVMIFTSLDVITLSNGGTKADAAVSFNSVDVEDGFIRL